MRTRRMCCFGAGSMAGADTMALKAVAFARRP